MTTSGGTHYENWDLFAMGAVEESERREMAAHLQSGCEDCAREYSAAQAVLAGLGTLSTDQSLPQGAELRMSERLRAQRPSANVKAAPAATIPAWQIATVAPWAVAALSLVAAILLGAGLHHAHQQLRDLELQNADNQSHSEQQTPIDNHSGVDAASYQLGELQKTIDGLRLELQATQTAKLQADEQLLAARTDVQQAEARVQELNASLKDAEEKRSRAEEVLAGARLQLTKVQGDANRLERITAQNEQIVGLLESPKLSQLDLKPAGSGQASARVFWQDDQGLLLVARDLPPLNQTGTYQLWFYRKGTPSVVNVGVVQLGRSGSGLLFVQPGPALGEMTGALVTEESELAGASEPGQEILKVKP